MDLLNSAGYAAEAFNNPDQFLKSGRVNGTSCVVADVRMPGMSGLELCDHLLKAGKDIPTVLITAFPKECDRARARELGVRSYLSKPFSEKELLSSVRLALSSQRGMPSVPIGAKSPDKRCSVGAMPSTSRGALAVTGPASSLRASVFHEPWWLSTVTDSRYEESIVKQGSAIVGRLPYVTVHRGPFRTIRMPPFTHLLGPVVDAGLGKPQTRLVRRLSIVRSLIDQLPPNSFFLQHLDPSLGDGLAKADGLAFQERDFSVAPQYTFQIDCRQSLNDIWAAMSQKTRQPIRRAEEKYSLRNVDDPGAFTDFYVANIKAGGLVNTLNFERFPALFRECRARNCGAILGAFDRDNEPIAMTYLVWSHGTMYYLLSTRSKRSDYGAVSLLLWSAMKHAHKLELTLDLDGVYSSGTARFLSSFGGKIKTRLTIRRSSNPYRAFQSLKRRYSGEKTHYFT